MSTRRRLAALVATTLVVFAVVIAVGRGGSPAGRSRRGSKPRPGTSVTQPDASTRSERVVSPATSPPSIASSIRPRAPFRGPWSVRQTTLEFYDPTRTTPARGARPAHLGRALRTTLRWPVSDDRRVASGRLPLVVFAHGYDVSGATYAALLDDLARAGIIVAAPEFPGESTAYPGSAVESDLVNEPCDMEFVAASLEHHPPAQLPRALQHALGHAPLIVAGHSDGATAAAYAAYAATCPGVPIRAVVALSPDDVPMTGAFRFGRPPALLAMTGTADEINPISHTVALYQHVPGPAWLVTLDGGSHLGTFTTDPDLAHISAIAADFTIMVSEHNARARAQLTHAASGRVHMQSR